MKKLNITKEQFEKSRYFKNKYGTLEYVSESGKVFKTDKGEILKFVNESENAAEYDAVGELCYEEGANVINATATIEEFNNKIYELTGKYVIDPDVFFGMSTELGMFIEDN